ncbi:hypothetical protein BDU57DRAFT_514022 [Ampelomyces quisqualis]|uniref:Uncharacterized protein n=1 Tax=Ampelomyces quisqualis TaxID=50730 RepID=A0A6A5QSS5_AMPQU|nr:hypothetical protein BDU57DRAFT_514022 [Ampelomyces quisqualis]
MAQTILNKCRIPGNNNLGNEKYLDAPPKGGRPSQNTSWKARNCSLQPFHASYLLRETNLAPYDANSSKYSALSMGRHGCVAWTSASP